MRKSLSAAILFLAVGSQVVAQKPLVADQVLAFAKSEAVKENKSIFLIFGASWCEDCHRLDTFLAAPKIQAIFDKHFVITRITVAEENGKRVLNNPGGLNLLVRFGGVEAGREASLPFIAVLDTKGNLITNSNRAIGDDEQKEEIGYPTKPEEIESFVTMLSEGSMQITAQDLRTIKNWLSNRR